MIYHMRLINGDEIMGFISNKTLGQQEFNVINPLLISHNVLESGAPVKTMKRYLYNAKQESISCFIRKEHIIAMYECDSDYSEYYHQFLDFIVKIYDTQEKTVMNTVSSTLLKANPDVQIIANNMTYH